MVNPKMTARHTHLRFGQFYGEWLHWNTGSVTYMAQREGSGSKGYYRLMNAWCIDDYTLEQCISRGVQWIIIKHIVSGFRKHAKKTVVEYYATRVEDFFGPRSGNHTAGTTKQRYLPRAFWRITPVLAEKAIAKLIAIGKVSHS